MRTALVLAHLVEHQGGGDGEVEVLEAAGPSAAPRRGGAGRRQRRDLSPTHPAGNGQRGTGLSPALAAACSRLVKIPMAGRLDSLNLAVATALMLYEMRKDRLRLS